MASLLFPDDPQQQPGAQGLLAIPSGDWRDTIAPQPTQADAADATAREYQAFLARDRQRQIDQGYVDPTTGERTPEGWKQQAQVIGGGLGPADVGMIGGGLLGSIKTYHGTPHLFEPTPKNPLGEFDWSKMGSGQGAQSYAHGPYVAEAEAVARDYRDSLTNTNPTVAHYLKLAQGDRGAAVGAFDRDVAANAFGHNIHPEELAHIRNQLETPPGHMYEVNLNAEPHEFLHWDKQMSDQSEGVQNAIRPVMQQDPKLAKLWLENPYGVEVYKHLAATLGNNEAAASQALRDAGIPGIRYLDANSRAAGPDHPDATHNYVMFDPDKMEIIRRYGIAGLIGGGAAATVAGGGKQDNTQ